MTIKGLRDGLIQDLAENVYLNYWFGLEGTKMLCEALEKQIPNKPYSTEKEGPYSAEFDYGCRNCRFWLSGKTNYCPNCGQRLEW